jgi:hypothetical protein
MKIKLKCCKCDDELEIYDAEYAYANGLMTIIIEVEKCECTDD